VSQTFILRLDLDSVPWQRGEDHSIATLLKLLEESRRLGWKLHVFATRRCLIAFPTLVDTLISEGHDLDLLLRSDDDPPVEFAKAQVEIGKLGHQFQGYAQGAHVVWDDKRSRSVPLRQALQAAQSPETQLVLWAQVADLSDAEEWRGLTRVVTLLLTSRRMRSLRDEDSAN
jgi:hypothetical protein